MAEDIVLEDANYVSEEDEDFNPTAVADGAGSESSGEEDTNQPATASKSGKSARRDDQLDFENSGDEATIQSAKARRRKRNKKKGTQPADDEDDASGVDVDLLDEDGGEGGLVKTRAQRKSEKAERKQLAGTEGATADVEAIWARLMSAPLKPAPGIDEFEKAFAIEDDLSIPKDHNQTNGASKDEPNHEKPAADPANTSHPSAGTADDDTITIHRTYDFAGETHTETKRVPKDSAEARLYLSSLDPSKPSGTPNPSPPSPYDPSVPQLRRPLKRPSRFEPNPTSEIRNLPTTTPLPRARFPIRNLRADKDAVAAAAAARTTMAANNKAAKLNTVTKSKMDWAGFVDQAGIAEELREHEKGGKAYLDRMEFLGRVEWRRDAEARGAKSTVVG
ncbi:BCNT-domain-containing protein [Viridothelium virens]|uniref:SWR1-complex protein 5 n=1 Tax=Viridothelium virens TaxID=1048519 RepID=A0A6A6GX98_VIRVR|nr:BCNT-domain-containing protein [Viridothelium virens]